MHYSALLEGVGLTTAMFDTSEAFLAQHVADREGCLLIDAYRRASNGFSY